MSRGGDGRTAGGGILIKLRRKGHLMEGAVFVGEVTEKLELLFVENHAVLLGPLRHVKKILLKEGHVLDTGDSSDDPGVVSEAAKERVEDAALKVVDVDQE